MFRLGDLVKTTPLNPEHNTVPAFAYSRHGEDKQNAYKIIAGQRINLPVDSVGIILDESGPRNNKWFMVHFANTFTTCWMSPVYLAYRIPR